MTNENKKLAIGDYFDEAVIEVGEALTTIDPGMTLGEAADWVETFAKTLQNCAATMRECPNGLLGEGK